MTSIVLLIRYGALTPIQCSTEPKHLQSNTEDSNLFRESGRFNHAPSFVLVHLCQTICIDRGKMLQITNCQTSKFKSIDYLRRQLSLKLEEIAVFGDNWNDQEILTEFPNGTAIGNADRELLYQIRYQTQNNNKDKMTYALHTLLGLI